MKSTASEQPKHPKCDNHAVHPFDGKCFNCFKLWIKFPEGASSPVSAETRAEYMKMRGMSHGVEYIAEAASRGGESLCR